MSFRQKAIRYSCVGNRNLVCLRTDIEQVGFVFRRSALAAEQLAMLLELFQPASEQTGIRRRGGSAYAARNVLWDNPAVCPTLKGIGLDQIASKALGKSAFPINVTCFDKNADANWKVPSHQDLMMPVAGEAVEHGFCGWREKLGVVYVEPPADVLASLLALRVHLDDCPDSNGPLAVVPGSHLRGKLRDADILKISSDQFTVCAAAAGDVLLIRPLLVHRSSAAIVPSRRRVLHVVYATDEPGATVRWKRAHITR